MAGTEPKKNKELENPSDVRNGTKSKIFKFLLIPIVLLIQAAVAYFLVFNTVSGKAQKTKRPKKQATKQNVGQFFEIKDIVINPAGSFGRRFFVVEMGFETHRPELVEEAESKRIWIRDAIISLLTEKSSNELLDITKRKQLKAQILNIVNKKLTRGKFEKLYFTKYIMQ